MGQRVAPARNAKQLTQKGANKKNPQAASQRKSQEGGKKTDQPAAEKRGRKRKEHRAPSYREVRRSAKTQKLIAENSRHKLINRKQVSEAAAGGDGDPR